MDYPEAAQQDSSFNNAKTGALIGGPRRQELTLRQNIDERIKQAQAHVAQLEATKVRMEASGILDMRIDDIRSAMQF